MQLVGCASALNAVGEEVESSRARIETSGPGREGKESSGKEARITDSLVPRR